MGERRPRRRTPFGQVVGQDEEMAPIPGVFAPFSGHDDGLILSVASVGALVAMARMSSAEARGRNSFDAIESVITGMLLYGVLEQVRTIGRRKARVSL